MKKINIVPIIFLFIILLLGVVGVSYAFFSSSFSQENLFETGNMDVRIEEEFYDDWGTKKVTFVNDSSIDVVLRTYYIENCSDGGDVISCVDSVTNNHYVVKRFTDVFYTKFILFDDGYYYYSEVLKPGDRITIMESIDSSYKVMDYELSFKYEVCQADIKAIKELWGLDVTIEGSDVHWG